MQTVRLTSQARREQAQRLVWQAPDGIVVKFAPPRRTDEQNNKMWADISDLIRAKVPGTKYPPYQVKSLAMEFAGHKPIWLPSWHGDGSMVCVGYKSSLLTVGEMRELIDAINAYAGMHGVELKD